MQNENPEQDDGDVEIDVDQWLFAIMAMTRNEESKEELIRKISSKTGQSPEKVEKIIVALLQVLAEHSRTNLN
ncbi:MAG: hypothetical protein IH588_19985 [Anaerolineales bacterium]|nr:hypothetical protein [Anaerolineales bacterium]